MERPGVLTVLAVFGFVFSGLGLLYGGFGLLGGMATTFFLFAGGATEGFQEMQASAMASGLWSVAEGLVAAGLAAWLGVVSLGLLRVVPWAERQARLYAITKLVWVVVAALGSAALGYLSMRLMPDPVGGGGANNLFWPGYAGVLTGLLEGLCAGAVGAIMPILLLALIRQPHVQAAFADSRTIREAERYDTAPGEDELG
jgi:hypothetical protein